MGKNTDKLYITQSEWATGGHSASAGHAKGTTTLPATAIALPFWTCSISQQPIQTDAGVTDEYGNVYDIRNLLPYIRKHSTNPVTGEPMTTKDVIKLKIATNSEHKYIDPISFKEFLPLSTAGGYQT
jgi:peptidyl-prolyl cis-trans isomerase-like protein 2